MASSQWLAVEASYTFDDFSAKDDFWNLNGHTGAYGVVIYAKSSSTSPHAGKQAVIDQRDKQFVSYVKAVQTDAPILFPNEDYVRHHVYSLSPAKRFESPLYAGMQAAPIIS